MSSQLGAIIIQVQIEQKLQISSMESQYWVDLVAIGVIRAFLERGSGNLLTQRVSLGLILSVGAVEKKAACRRP